MVIQHRYAAQTRVSCVRVVKSWDFHLMRSRYLISSAPSQIHPERSLKPGPSKIA
jgi:hypothetical protein